MKRFLILFNLITVNATAQKNQKNKEPELYLWNASFQAATNTDSAAFVTEVLKLNDSCWQWDTYHYAGPLYSSEQFRDHDGTKPHGRFISYHSDGYIDSSGYSVNGLVNGDWNYYNDTGKLILQKTYTLGKLVSVRDFLSDPERNIDSLLPGEQESEFPGGLKQWQRYLYKNIKYPQRAINFNKHGIVKVIFEVNTNGNPDQVRIFRSIEFSLDREALRIIQNSPGWSPAKKDGVAVKSYKIQPIHFGLIDE